MSRNRMAKPDLVFFLGGHDLEMQTIAALLARVCPDDCHDAKLSWQDARASMYRASIKRALERGQTPVLVELQDDLNLQQVGALIVDHHGDRSGRAAPTSLEQVFALLELPRSCWTRYHELVVANDRGYIPALVEAGASQAEIIEIRRSDRAAQGINPAQEQAAERALQAIESHADGRLLVAHLPHERTAALVDRLAPELGGGGYENLLVISPREFNFFGEGEVVQALRARYEKSWSGGALPDYGFWGMSASVDGDAFIAELAQLIEQARPS